MNIDANVGSHQCLSFYHHDIGCNLEANGLRKWASIASPFYPRETTELTQAFSLSFLVQASIIVQYWGTLKENSFGLGNMSSHHFGRCYFERNLQWTSYVSLWLLCWALFRLTNNSQLLEQKHFTSWLKWDSQELEILLVSFLFWH